MARCFQTNSMRIIAVLSAIFVSQCALASEETIWFSIDDINSSSLSPEQQLMVRTTSSGIVRLHTPVVPRRPSGSSNNSRAGCTAWRVSTDLFATAWHCLALRDQRSCDRASITFDYKPPANGPRRGFDSVADWGKASESCAEIVYSNDRLDFVLFRVTTSNYELWKDAAILRVLSNSLSFPQTSSARQRTGDRIVVLHYPRTSRCVDIRTRGRVTGASEDDGYYVNALKYQSGLKVSAYDADTNPQCRVWVPQPGSAGDNAILSRPNHLRPEPTIRTILGRNPDPQGNFWAFNPVDLPSDIPPFGLLHRCTACEGTSGAPMISIEPPPEAGPARFGTVVGVHSGFYPRSSGGVRLFDGYFGTRMSVIAQCIDMHAIGELGRDGQLIFTEGAEAYGVCRARIPLDAPHFDCSEAMPSESDCRYYLRSD